MCCVDCVGFERERERERDPDQKQLSSGQKEILCRRGISARRGNFCFLLIMASTKKSRLRFSKLYTFGGIFKPSNAQRAEVSTSLGGPGFSRIVFCNQSEKHNLKPYKYSSNYVSTAKYNVITFFPKALFEQFRRVANLYFLLAAALSLTPVSPYTPYSLILPLVFVVGVSMGKEALEDWRRFRQVYLFRKMNK